VYPQRRAQEWPHTPHRLNYLCAGYKALFIHVDKPMRLMAELLRRKSRSGRSDAGAGSRRCAIAEGIRQSGTEWAMSLWQWSHIQALSREINVAARHEIRSPALWHYPMPHEGSRPFSRMYLNMDKPCSNRVPASPRERSVHTVSVERHWRGNSSTTIASPAFLAGNHSEQALSERTARLCCLTALQPNGGQWPLLVQ
jgi:hypothetical protein